MASDYKGTMNLPKTAFPMRASLAQREPARLETWRENDVYELARKKNEGHEKFVLHDGPPYANGPIHVGHALNKISKDMINRYWIMQGRDVPYVPGWDCHGQPIEHKVEEKLGTAKFNATPVAKIRELCNKFAVENIDLQRKGFRRLGVLADWEHPYLTLYHQHDAADIEVFKAIYDKGAIYRGRKPVHWCKHCHTALAEAEIEYAPEKGYSLYVAFELVDRPKGLEGFDGPVDVVIWTTTPWTLPANAGVALHPEAAYVAVVHDGRAAIMAKDRVAAVCEKAGWEPVLACGADGEPWSLTGDAFAGLTYKHPIFEGVTGRFIYADYVSMDDGSGCVHTAPGHGVDDYNAGCRFDLPIVMPVDDDGRLYKGEEYGSGGPFGGLDTDEANPKIVEWLKERGTCVAVGTLEHSYPHCWRCKQPVIFRATDQWFVSMDKTGLRQEAGRIIDEDVTWYPAHASKRIGAMVAQRPDWCISRQRNWGVPIPSYTCADCGEKVLNDDTLDAVIKLFHEKGSDAWFTDEPASYLGDACTCPKCGGHNLKADRDILDVWWDSGVSWKAVCEYRPELRYPADMYLEGSDQHRGWFQSGLLTSVGANGCAPYKSVVSQGFVLDGQGRKMSKSLGNVIDPNKVCDELGADILRLWVASTDTTTDVAIDQEILKRTSDAYRRFRNTIRFLLSELYDFDPAVNGLDTGELMPLDAMALARMCEVHDAVSEAYAGYRFNAVFRSLYEYVVTELSNVYLDAVKDRTYCDAPDSKSRRSAQTVLAHILSMLVHDLQPILAFTCDEAMEYLPESMREGQRFAALLDWYKKPMDDAEELPLLDAYRAALSVRDVVTKALETARAEGVVTKSQEASVKVTCPAATAQVLSESGADLAEFFIIADVTLVGADVEEPACEVAAAAGEKCPRCWNVRTLGADGLCARCHDAVAAHDGACTCGTH